MYRSWSARPDTSESRDAPIKIQWSGFLIGHVTVGGVYWAAVEWSEKRQAWCIEDAEGRCLSHKSHIHGQAVARDEAVALAEAMIRDGRMPTPQEAWDARKARDEKRHNQPAQKPRIEERNRRTNLLNERFTREFADQETPPLDEVFDDVFDFTDPELWKSNSWAAVRPRLSIYAAARVARLESKLADLEHKAKTIPFMMYATAEQRRAATSRRQHNAANECHRIIEKLDRARHILAVLQEGAPRDHHMTFSSSVSNSRSPRPRTAGGDSCVRIGSKL